MSKRSYFRNAPQRRASRARQLSPRTSYRRPLRFEPLEERRLLALVTVTTLSDTVDFSDGVTSLREAVFAANIVSGPNEIEFAPALTAGGPATILLTQGELAITDSLTITGLGASLLTIDASGNDPTPDQNNRDGSRIFNIDNGASSVIDVELTGLSLTGGDVEGSGGAIFSREHLSAQGLIVSGNHAFHGGAIAHGAASAHIADSSFVGNTAYVDGGAVLIETTATGTVVTLASNAFADNSAARGGAIAARNAGTNTSLIIDGSTILDNSATQVGGGGGGIAIFGSASTFRVSILHSTISGNEAESQGGGLSVNAVRDLSIVDTVITGNKGGFGGGISSLNSDVAITASTISANEAGLAGGGIYSRSTNFAGELTIHYSTVENNVALGGSGGGGIYSSRDRLTLVGSRISGNAAKGTADNNQGGGIWHAPNVTFPVMLADTAIEGNSAGGSGGGLYFSTDGLSNVSLTFNNLTISGNSAARGGGGVAIGPNSGTQAGGLTIHGGMVSNNTARFNGGGISSNLAQLTVNAATISGNRARNHGGGIATAQFASSLPVQVSIFGATLANNTAGADDIAGPGVGDGGAIWIPTAGSAVTVLNTAITNNTAGIGGGIYRGTQSGGGSLYVSGSTISSNVAEYPKGGGGGIYNLGGVFSLHSSSVTGNQSSTGGGGIYNRTADLSIVNSSVSGNAALQGRGGGVYHSGGDLAVTGSTIAVNSAKIDGGGILAITNALQERITIHSSTISGNTSERTGGMYLRGDSTVRHSTIAGNTGGRNGVGGILAGDGSSRFELDHSIVAGNTSRPLPAQDILFFLSMSSVTLRSSLIGDNSGTLLVEAPLGAPDVHGNLIGKPLAAGGSGAIDPLLGPLAANGGPTQTHALLPGSPALDGGALVTGPPLGYDQRGNPFSRMVDGTGDGVVRIDIGAFESQGVPLFAVGDCNHDGLVDTGDYILWRKTLGQVVAPLAGADMDGSGIIDQGDYTVWRANFGNGLAFAAAQSAVVLAVTAAPIVEAAPSGDSASVADIEPTAEPVAEAEINRASPSAAPPAANTVPARRVRPLAFRPVMAPRDNSLLNWLTARPHDTAAKDVAIAEHGIVESAAEEDAPPTDLALDWAFAALGS